MAKLLYNEHGVYQTMLHREKFGTMSEAPGLPPYSTISAFQIRTSGVALSPLPHAMRNVPEVTSWTAYYRVNYEEEDSSDITHIKRLYQAPSCCISMSKSFNSVVRTAHRHDAEYQCVHP